MPQRRKVFNVCQFSIDHHSKIEYDDYLETNTELDLQFFIMALRLRNQIISVKFVTVHGVSAYDVTGIERRFESNQVIRKTSNEDESTTNDRTDDEQTVYVYEFGSKFDKNKHGPGNKEEVTAPGENDIQNPLDPWSIVWYIGSFGGLVAFFLIVSCSEWCCRRSGRPLAVPYAQRADVIGNGQVVTETPPPPYHLFAPPPYDSVNYGDIVDKTSGEKLDIYVISVPIHRPIVQVPV
ncbi:hypothetical protein KM043_016009 [Ampulex compressa]|nr:hypothetical protein KM043_016009 [Ampulex compressa]